MTMSLLGFSQRLLVVRAVSDQFPRLFSLTGKISFLCLCSILFCKAFVSFVNAQVPDCNSITINTSDACPNCQSHSVTCQNCVDRKPVRQGIPGRRSRCRVSSPGPKIPPPPPRNEVASIQNIQANILTPQVDKPWDGGLIYRIAYWSILIVGGSVLLLLAVRLLVFPIYHYLKKERVAELSNNGNVTHPCDTTVMVEMMPELRLWTEASIECLLKPPVQVVKAKSWFGVTFQKLSVIGDNIRKAEYRADLLKALREELEIRIDLRNLEIRQRLSEHVAAIQQVQIENHRQRLLRQRNNPHLNGSLSSLELADSLHCAPLPQLPARPECSPKKTPPPPPEPDCPRSPDQRPENPPPNQGPDNKQPEKGDGKGGDGEQQGSARMTGPQSKAPYRPPHHRGRTGYSLPPEKGLRSKYPGRAGSVTYEFRLRLEGHSDVVEAVAFSPDGETLASAGRDKTIRFWNSHTGKVIKYETLHCESEVNSIAFSPTGDLLVSGHENGEVRVWAMASLSPLAKFNSHTGAVQSVAFSPNGGTFASASADGKVGIWNSDLLREVKMLPDHSEEVCAVAFSPDGKLLASASRDHSIRTWNTNVLPGWGNTVVNQKLDGHLGDVSTLAFSPNSQLLASASWDRTIRLWEKAVDGSLISKPPLLEEHSESISSVAFSPDGLVLASGGWDCKVVLWDATDPTLCWQVLATLAKHTGAVTSVAFSIGSKYLASASDDKSVILWMRKQK